MRLFKAIVNGFGFTVGAAAAEEALEAADRELADREAKKATPAELEARAKTEAEARARAEKARIEAATVREKEIDAELAALKKRVARGE